MRTPAFQKGRPAPTGGVFEPALLPDDEKLALCRALLAELGVTTLRKQGDELIHACPLPWATHRDQAKNPTASLNFKKLTFRCLGSCDAGGGLLWFIAMTKGTSASSARDWLNEQTGLVGYDDATTLVALLAHFDAVYDRTRKERPPLPFMSETILDPWLLIHPYLTEVRGIPVENVMRFKVGWNRNENRIVIPHFWLGRLTGWQTRRLLSDGTPKYLSSPDFPRAETLFDYDGSAKVAVVVEAPMTVVSKAHLGDTRIGQAHWEATFGASVTEEQVRLLTIHPRVALWFDNDEAGWGATRKVAEALSPYSDVWVVDSPWVQDAGDLPDEVATLMLTEHLIPWSVWSPPRSPRDASA